MAIDLPRVDQSEFLLPDRLYRAVQSDIRPLQRYRIYSDYVSYSSFIDMHAAWNILCSTRTNMGGCCYYREYYLPFSLGWPWSYHTTIPLLTLWQACYLGVLAYLISRVIILFENSTVGKDMMLLFAFVSLVLTAATVICAIVCITNFDRGFKMINRSKNGSGRSSNYLQPNSLPLSHPDSRPSSRLTLD